MRSSASTRAGSVPPHIGADLSANGRSPISPASAAEGRRGEWYKHNGDWQPCDELFGEGGLQGILDEIKSRGMLPGVWLEIETADASSDFAKAHPEALLTRHGHPIGRGQCFVDFRQQVVRDHLMKVFDDLYNMGVRFIKNDYNHSTGIGIDPLNGEDKSMAEALRDHTEAFYAFVDEVIDMYLAEGLTFGETDLDEDEFIEVERIPLDELVDRICRGEVPDSKTQACVLRAKFEKLRRAGEV